MKKKELIRKGLVVLIASAILMSGCNERNTIDPITSSENAELRCWKPDTFSNEKKFWNYAYENIPTVTMADIASGKYNDSYVCIDVFAKCAIIQTLFIEFQAVVQDETGKYEQVMYTPEIGEDAPLKYGTNVFSELKQNDKIKLCSFVSNGRFQDMSIIGAKNLGQDTSFDVEKFVKEEKAKEEAEDALKISEDSESNTSESSNIVTKGKHRDLMGRGHSDSGREQPDYKNVIGYVSVGYNEETLLESNNSFSETPWKIPIYDKIDGKYVETGSVDHKTEIIVISQDLEHEEYSNYSGFLLVENIDNNEQFYINVNNFITKNYWSLFSLEDAASFGYFIAEYHQTSKYSPITSSNQTVTINDGTTVLVIRNSSRASNNSLEAIVFKEWENGYGGISIFFNKDDLSLIY